VAAPYDEDGVKYDEGETLTSGKSTTVEGEINK